MTGMEKFWFPLQNDISWLEVDCWFFFLKTQVQKELLSKTISSRSNQMFHSSLIIFLLLITEKSQESGVQLIYTAFCDSLS